MSQSRRAMIECIFGRAPASHAQDQHCGIGCVAANFLLKILIAYNLIRIPKTDGCCSGAGEQRPRPGKQTASSQ